VNVDRREEKLFRIRSWELKRHRMNPLLSLLELEDRETVVLVGGPLVPRSLRQTETLVKPAEVTDCGNERRFETADLYHLELVVGESERPAAFVLGCGCWKACPHVLEEVFVFLKIDEADCVLLRRLRRGQRQDHGQVFLGPERHAVNQKLASFLGSAGE